MKSLEEMWAKYRDNVVALDRKDGIKIDDDEFLKQLFYSGAYAAIVQIGNVGNAGGNVQQASQLLGLEAVIGLKLNDKSSIVNITVVNISDIQCQCPKCKQKDTFRNN